MGDSRLVSSDGVELQLRDFHSGSGPTALFVHATSFTATTLRPLADSLSGWESFGLDLRGHGVSGRESVGEFSWRSLGLDVDAALDALGTSGAGPVIAVGHSAGATGLLLAATKRPELFSFLYCYEPIALTPALRDQIALPPQLARAASRRAQFSSRDEARQYLVTRPPISDFDPAVIDCYVSDGLVDDENGGVRLACDPAYEASIYEAGYAADVFDELTGATCPVVIACGADSVGIGPACAPLISQALRKGSLVDVRGLGHLGPLEDPRLVAQSVLTTLVTTTT